MDGLSGGSSPGASESLQAVRGGTDYALPNAIQNKLAIVNTLVAQIRA